MRQQRRNERLRATHGTIVHLQRNPETGGLRLAFAFDPGESRYAEMRAQLRKDGQMASEVWLYRWTE